MPNFHPIKISDETHSSWKKLCKRSRRCNRKMRRIISIREVTGNVLALNLAVLINFNFLGIDLKKGMPLQHVQYDTVVMACRLFS